MGTSGPRRRYDETPSSTPIDPGRDPPGTSFGMPERGSGDASGIFHELAEGELNEAAAYYAHARPGLGDAFVVEVQHAVDRLAA